MNYKTTIENCVKILTESGEIQNYNHLDEQTVMFWCEDGTIGECGVNTKTTKLRVVISLGAYCTKETLPQTCMYIAKANDVLFQNDNPTWCCVGIDKTSQLYIYSEIAFSDVIRSEYDLSLFFSHIFKSKLMFKLPLRRITSGILIDESERPEKLIAQEPMEAQRENDNFISDLIARIDKKIEELEAEEAEKRAAESDKCKEEIVNQELPEWAQESVKAIEEENDEQDDIELEWDDVLEMIDDDWEAEI